MIFPNNSSSQNAAVSTAAISGNSEYRAGRIVKAWGCINGSEGSEVEAMLQCENARKTGGTEAVWHRSALEDLVIDSM